jgi:asparagine synthase (glutamine-hydrolysing)
VIFNGEGGDQLFGGWANKPMIAAEVYGGEGYDREAAYLATYHRFHGLGDRLYTPRAQAMLLGVDAREWVRPALRTPGFRSLIHRLRAANLWLKGAQNIAPRATQLAVAHGLRACMPYFDRELAEWTFGLPPEWLLHGACEKYLLKRAAAPYLPAEVIWREKRGMGVPTAEWCLGGLRREVGRWLDSRTLRREGWLEPAFVEALRRGDEQPEEHRRRRVGERLWALLALRVWLSVQDPPLDLPAVSARLSEARA